MQVLKGMQFQEQDESKQITLLQTTAALGSHCRGANAELLVLVGLLSRIGDPNACMTAMAAELLLGMLLDNAPLSPHVSPAEGNRPLLTMNVVKERQRFFDDKLRTIDRFQPQPLTQCPSWSRSRRHASDPSRLIFMLIAKRGTLCRICCQEASQAGHTAHGDTESAGIYGKAPHQPTKSTG